jgi:transposase
MINFETYHEVRRLSRELNLTPAQIAAKSGLNIKTIRKWLDKPRYEPRSKGAKRTSKLDPYKDLIVSWLEKHPYTGMQIFQRLRSEHGYTDPSCRTSLSRYGRSATRPSLNWLLKRAIACKSIGPLMA